MTYLVVGLGNPGPRYAATRHNAGFMVVEHLAEDIGVAHFKEVGGAVVGMATLGGNDVVLAMPQTFMNVCGPVVARLLRRYEVSRERVVIVHDDLDVRAASVKVKQGGGHGGHNGLRSVHEVFGDGAYVRVRVGVGRPPGRQDPAAYVLELIDRRSAEDLSTAVLSAVSAVRHIIERGVDSAMNEFNAREERLE